jgi:hypothetical protein
MASLASLKLILKPPSRLHPSVKKKIKQFTLIHFFQVLAISKYHATYGAPAYHGASVDSGALGPFLQGFRK